jgi:4-amino-4-deoxy-L-arabinose transferase-like glycosyltransferase
VREGLERAARRGAGAIAGRRGAVVALVVLAVLVRAIAVVADPGYVPRNDAYDFHRHAESIAGGDGYPEATYSAGGGENAFRPPAYPFFLAAVYAVAGGGHGEPSFLPPSGSAAERFDSHWIAGRIVNIALGALAVLLIYLIAGRIWGRRVALIAGGIAAVFPPMVLLVTELMSESLFVPIELGMVLAVLIFRDRGGPLRWAALAGLLAGLAALTRANGIVLIPLAMAGVWVARPWLNTRALTAPAVVLLVAMLAIAPWALRNYVVTGRFIPVTTQLGFGMAGTYNQTSLEDDEHHAPWLVPALVDPYSSLFVPSIDEPTLHGVLREEATDFALEHPGYVAEATMWNTLRTFDLADPGVYSAGRAVTERGVGVSRSELEPLSLLAVAALAVLGLIVLLRRPSLGGNRSPGPPARLRGGPPFMWLVPVLLLASVLPIIGLPRYRATVDPFIVMLAALGVAYLWQRISAARGG